MLLKFQDEEGDGPETYEHVLRGGWKGRGKSHQPASEWGVGISRRHSEGCQGSFPLSRWPDSAFLKQSVVALRKTSVKGLEGLSKVKSSKPALSGKLDLGPLKKNDPPNQCYNEHYGKQGRDQQSPSHQTGSALRPSWDSDNPLHPHTSLTSHSGSPSPRTKRTVLMPASPGPNWAQYRGGAQNVFLEWMREFQPRRKGFAFNNVKTWR